MKHYYRFCLTVLILQVLFLFVVTPVLAGPMELSLQDSIKLSLQNNAKLKIAAQAKEKLIIPLGEAPV